MAAFTSRTQFLGVSYPGNQAALSGEIDREHWYTLTYIKAVENGAITKDSPKYSPQLVCEILHISLSSELEKANAHSTFIPKS